MWELRESPHSAIRSVWRADVAEPGIYRLPATEFWGISFVRHDDGTLAVEIDGPTLQPSTTRSVPGERYWGVELAAHVRVRDLAKADLNPPRRFALTDGHVVLSGQAFAVPRWGELERFVDDLLQADVLVADEDVRRGLTGNYAGLAQRTWQRKFRAVVGMSPYQVAQLRRTRHAYALLRSGSSPAVAAATAGFADQPHLTRALRRFQGDTPARVVAGHARSR